LGKELGWMVIGLSVIILIVEWYLAMKKDFRWYLWTACLTIVVSQWIILSTNPGHIVGLILPLILISAMFTERWPRGGQWMAVLITAVLFIWEWILFTKYIIHPQLGIPLSIFIPFPLILFIGLYWVRWWAIRPKRLLIEEQWLGEIY
jgi:hypothetical protein